MSIRLMRRIGAVLCLLMLAGCASWFSSHKGPEPTPLQTIKPSADLRVLWSGRTAALENAIMSPAASGETLYAAGRDGTVAAYREGRELWRVAIGQKLSSGVGANDKSVIVGTAKGEVVALDATSGAQQWRVTVQGEPHNAPLVGAEQVVVRVGDNKLVALNLADGSARWTYRRTGATLSVHTYAGLLQADRYVFAGFQSGKLVAVSQDNGAAVWEGTVALPRGSNELERMTDVVGDPVVIHDGICAGAYQGRIACFDTRNGTALWTRDFSTATGVAADDRSLYFSDEKSAIYALDLQTGTTLWKQDQLAYRNISRPLVIGKYLAVADALGWVHLLDRSSGHFVARQQIGSAAVAGPLVGLGSGFVVQSKDGSLTLLSVH